MNNLKNFLYRKDVVKMASNEIFVSEPIAEKPVTALAGIGETLGKRLSDKGFDKVCVSYWYMDFEF